MTGDHYVVIRVAYDRRPAYSRSLSWIAPEVRDAGLIMTEDRSDEANASRTWAGVVDGATFARFADAWWLDAKPRDRTLILATAAGDLDMRACTSIRRDEPPVGACFPGAGLAGNVQRADGGRSA